MGYSPNGNLNKLIFVEEGEKVGCQFRSEAFVEWLNVYPLKNSPEKAKVISRCIPMLCY